MRPPRLVLLGLLAAAAAATVVFWPWLDAQRRAVIVLSGTSHTPVLSWAVRVATGTPRLEDASIAATPVTLVRPGRGSRWPAVVLLPGTAAQGRDDPNVRRLAGALARAGFLVAIPELPGAADAEVVGAGVRSAVAVALEIARRDDVSGARVALAGAWSGGTQALLAAEDPILAPRVSVVAAVAPWGAAPNLLRLATTGLVLDGGELKPYKADPLLSLVAARSLAAALDPGTDRDQLLRLLLSVARDDPDPLRIVRGLSLGNVRPDVAAAIRLLANTHGPSFDRFYAALPASLRQKVERLSPLIGAGGLQARVEIATAPHDRFVPPLEAQALERASPHIHLTVTGAVADGLPDPSFTQSFSADAFVVRALRAAA